MLGLSRSGHVSWGLTAREAHLTWPWVFLQHMRRSLG